MTKNELKNRFIASDNKLFALVGPNNSGKSYFLTEELYKDLDTNVFYLDENGHHQIKGDRKKVKIYNDFYYYIDENSRGKGNEEFPSEPITESSKKIDDFLSDMIKKVNFKNKSLGTQKLYNIFNSLISYNLNHINYVLLDEPENSLDDEAIKYIEKLIYVLIHNEKKVFFVTHSPRLLELLQISINDIYVIPKIYSDIKNYSLKEVYSLFDKTGDEIIKLLPQNSCKEYEKFDFYGETVLRKVYINELLGRHEFYRVLFYSHVVIVEGDTEEFLIRSAGDSLNFSKCIFNAHGKYRIPFLFKLFSLFCSKVTCIIDSDSGIKDQNNAPYLITKYLEHLKKNDQYFVYSIPNDMENFLSVDVGSVVATLAGLTNLSNGFVQSFSKYYKPYLPYYVITTNSVAKEKVISLFNATDNKYQF